MLYLYFILLIAAVAVGYVWFTRKIWFYRDPDHSKTPQESEILRSPVYGVVAYVKRIESGVVVSDKKGEEIRISEITKEDWPREYAEGDGWLIGIAMTALDVHYQYAPLPCTVVSIRHHSTGRNLPMFDLWEYIRITWLRQAVQLWAKKYIVENERQTFWLASDRVKLALVLIADKFVDKITTFVSEREEVPGGGKLSFIARGSQVDVVVCGHPGLEPLVSVGQAVHGPLTPIARLGPPKA